MYRALLALFIVIAAGAASAANLDTVACSDKTDTEAVVTAGIAEPSLELGAGANTAALIAEKFAAGLCAKAEDLDITLEGVDMRPAADGIRLGVAQIGDRYAVVMTGILDF